MRHTSSRWLISVLLMLLVGTATSAMASSSFEFLFSASHASDDHEVFLGLAVQSYGKDRDTIERTLPHLHHVRADLPIALFLASASGRSLHYVVGKRANGHSWEAIFVKLGVSLDVLFRGVHRDPGPPYGKAWGHWKKRSGSLHLSDRDIGAWVEIQIGHRVLGISAYDLAVGVSGGRSVFAEVAHRKGPGASSKAKPSHPGKDNGKGKDKGKGKKGQ